MQAAFAAGVGHGFARFGQLGFLRQLADKDFRGFAAGGADARHLRHLRQHGVQIHAFDNVQEFVRSIAVHTDGFEHGGAGGDAAFPQEGFDFFGIERFARCGDEMRGVVEKDDAVHAPHVVLEIGVVKRHGAFVGRRRERAHQHYGGVRRQHGRIGQGFDDGVAVVH